MAVGILHRQAWSTGTNRLFQPNRLFYFSDKLTRLFFSRKVSTIVPLRNKFNKPRNSFLFDSLVSSRTSIQCQRLSCYIHRCSSSVVPSFLKALEFSDRTAVVDESGRHTYDQLLRRAKALSAAIDNATPYNLASSSEAEPRVALLTPNDSSYVVATWASWISNCVVVPLHSEYPVGVLRYYLDDAGVSIVVASESMKHLAEALVDDVEQNPTSFASADAKCKPRCVFMPEDHGGDLDQESLDHLTDPTFHQPTILDEEYEDLLRRDYFASKRALIIYTSGSTGPPKGVVLTHGNIAAQVDNMVSAWEWSGKDLLLHVLPLHHVHGIVNCLYTPLQVGACVHFLPKFDAAQIFIHLTTPLEDISGHESLYHSVFMAVPTIYVKLLQHAATNVAVGDLPVLREMLLSRVRLMVSGSAALPTPVFDDWFNLSGHRLLERYGMTEIGMALSNPLEPTKRIPGSVGSPMPSVKVALAAEGDAESTDDYRILAECCGNKPDDVIVHSKSTSTSSQNGDSSSSSSSPISGELFVSGPSVFTQYWNRPSETRESFTPDRAWFKTGDTAVVENGIFRIFGRTSVDVIKSGGYKISALDVERNLLTHPNIVDVAVLGVPDHEWGQIVGAVVVERRGGGGGAVASLTLQELRIWSKEKMPTSWIPRKLVLVDTIPRNAMGKVNKKTLVKEIFPS